VCYLKAVVGGDADVRVLAVEAVLEAVHLDQLLQLLGHHELVV